eukprot:COSAG02_NODE_41527_length_393_cov_1.462585_1_plen_52_part_01
MVKNRNVRLWETKWRRDAREDDPHLCRTHFHPRIEWHTPFGACHIHILIRDS